MYCIVKQRSKVILFHDLLKHLYWNIVLNSHRASRWAGTGLVEWRTLVPRLGEGRATRGRRGGPGALLWRTPQDRAAEQGGVGQQDRTRHTGPGPSQLSRVWGGPGSQRHCVSCLLLWIFFKGMRKIFSNGYYLTQFPSDLTDASL